MPAPGRWGHHTHHPPRTGPRGLQVALMLVGVFGRPAGSIEGEAHLKKLNAGVVAATKSPPRL